MMRAALSRWWSASADLVALWWALVCAAPLVPPGSTLARPDLLPWVTLTLCLGLLLRAGTLGDGPHPMLRARRAWFAGLFRRAAVALTPAALLALYELCRSPDRERALLALGLFVVLLAGRRVGAEHGQTAWEPDGGGAGAVAALSVLGVLGLCALSGAIAGLLPTGPLRVLPEAALLGASVLGAGLVAGRPVHLAQRRAAGRRDGQPYRPGLFRPLLALVGPGLAWALLCWLYTWRFGALGFEQAFAASLLVLAWVGLLWPPPRPAAVQCTLHEVVPVGGGDAGGEGTASDFDQPPEGALRLNPLRVRRTNAVHFWLVPVVDARIGAFDDPVRPLWARPAPPLPSHALGDVAFEVIGGQPQTSTLTVRLRGVADVATVGAGDVATRRVAVLRPWPTRPWSRRRAPATYRWQEALPADAIQVVDASTPALHLRDGDLLVVSVEGVARAYQLEIGAPLPVGSELLHRRPPQLEDYSRP